MAYRVHIRQFDGPLDLLLHLIGRAEIDIADIFVSEITQQYLSYMDQLDEVDMDTASDFLAMAATLLYIKSRHLLPRPPREEAEDAQEDPEQALIRQLREYKAFKEAGGELQALLQSARDSFTRLPEDVPLPPPRACIHSRSTWAERPGTMSSSLAGLPSQRGVRSTITVTYRSPNAPWRHTCSSTPIARTEENRSACSSNSMPRSRTARSTTAHAT